MAAGSITLSYGSTSVSFDKFSGDDLPRSFLTQASLEFSALGVPYAQGSTKRQKRIWSIASYGDIAQWNNLLSIFDDWEAVRITGSNLATVTLTDTLIGSTVIAQGYFTDPPALSKLSPGNNQLFLISFAITEV
jgi:hypothetical protein